MFTSSKNNKRTSQEDLDMIRIKLSDIDNTSDQTFLLEKLHCHIKAIEEELRHYRDRPPSTPDDQERCEELKQLKEDAQDIRRKILDYQLPGEHWGLFIKYPKGYEG